LEAGAILTKIEMCSVCGTDVHLWQGLLSAKVELPVILGHEMVGRIVAMGSGTQRDTVGQEVRVGDRIVSRNGLPSPDPPPGSLRPSIAQLFFQPEDSSDHFARLRNALLYGYGYDLVPGRNGC